MKFQCETPPPPLRVDGSLEDSNQRVVGCGGVWWVGFSFASVFFEGKGLILMKFLIASAEMVAKSLNEQGEGFK